MTPEISTRAHLMPASPIRKLMPLAEEAVRSGVRVLHLNIGQPDLETAAPIRERISKIDEKILSYSPSPGTPQFIDAMVSYYRRQGLEISAGEILATTGASEAILFSLIACADEQEEVLVVEPFYTNYLAFAAMAGVRLVPVTSRGRDGFHLPPKTIWERALTPETRAVLLCNPSNPTGAVYERHELDMVADFCRAHDLFLISDEVYREFVYDGRKAISALSLAGSEHNVVVVDSLSKRYSACGIRLGTLVTRNARLFDAALRMAQGRLSAPGIAQRIAIGMDELGEEYSASVLAEYEHRRDILYEGLQAIPGVFLCKPEGAFYCVARLPILDSEDFAQWLLRDFRHEGATVMLSPARGFYASSGLGLNEVRLAYVLGEEDLRAALQVLAAALERYRELRGITDLQFEEIPSAASRS